MGTADGAQRNWRFLVPHVGERILDFYHVAEYVARAATAAEPRDHTKRAANGRQRAATPSSMKAEPSPICCLLVELETTPVLDAPGCPGAASCATTSEMDYPGYRAAYLPIGSGVTEVACKTLVKQRLCASGMRWKQAGVAIVLSLRALILTSGRCSQFWELISKGSNCRHETSDSSRARGSQP